LKKLFKDLFNSIWTLIGLFITWLVLEGETRNIVAIVLVCGFVIWLATSKIRNSEETKNT